MRIFRFWRRADAARPSCEEGPLVALYTKPGCHLCEEAHQLLERIRRATPFRLEEVDITTDETLIARYGDKIPVVAINGEDRFWFRINERRFRRELGKG